MTAWFTALLALLVLMTIAAVWDVIKLADYPTWVRAIGVIWLAFTALLAGSVMLTKPNLKQTSASSQVASTSGSNSPIIQTGDYSPVTFSQGISDQDAARIAKAVRRGFQPEPRTLSAEQAQSLRSQLLPLAGKSVKAVFIIGDPETATYADKILEAMRQSGLNLETTAIGMSIPPFYDLTIHVHNALGPGGALGVDLLKVFSAAGIPVKGIIDPNIPDGEAQVVIGPSSPPG